jgi:hypothetical protein
MKEHETEDRQRFNALFVSYGPDIVANRAWRAGPEITDEARGEDPTSTQIVNVALPRFGGDLGVHYRRPLVGSLRLRPYVRRLAARRRRERAHQPEPARMSPLS